MEHLAVAQAAPTGMSSATTLVGSPQPPAPATSATDMAAEGEALASAPCSPCTTVVARTNIVKLPHVPTVVEGKRVLTVDDFRIIRVLGEGGHGLVLLVQDQLTDKLFALKVISKDSVKYLDHVAKVLIEKDAMQALMGNPSFVGIKGSFEDEDNFLFLMDYYPGGTLHDKIQRVGRFPMWMARRYAAQLILAMEELHRNRIIHRDIKPKNILLTDHDQVVISDFGIARMFGRTVDEQPWRMMEEVWKLKEDLPTRKAEDEQYKYKATPACDDITTTECGTEAYIAPETRYFKYSYEVDVWAVAVTIFEMLHGKLPFGYDGSLTKGSARVKAVFGMIKFDSDLDPDAVDLLQAMFQADPRKRPTWEQIKAHRWFDTINWDEIGCRQPAPAQKDPENLRPDSLSEYIRLGRPYAQDKLEFPIFQWTAPELEDVPPSPPPIEEQEDDQEHILSTATEPSPRVDSEDTSGSPAQKMSNKAQHASSQVDDPRNSSNSLAQSASSHSQLASLASRSPQSPSSSVIRVSRVSRGSGALYCSINHGPSSSHDGPSPVVGLGIFAPDDNSQVAARSSAVLQTVGHRTVNASNVNPSDVMMAHVVQDNIVPAISGYDGASSEFSSSRWGATMSLASVGDINSHCSRISRTSEDAASLQRFASNMGAHTASSSCRASQAVAQVSLPAGSDAPSSFPPLANALFAPGPNSATEALSTSSHGSSTESSCASTSDYSGTRGSPMACKPASGSSPEVQPSLSSQSLRQSLARKLQFWCRSLAGTRVG
ncbi:kinase-like protein [Trametes sanguinea]|nr:kinase-like protein [Trametes sanguinea]